MTFREKLMNEHPKCIWVQYEGGCLGCPEDYGYEDDDACPIGIGGSCDACWDREMPEWKE